MKKQDLKTKHIHSRYADNRDLFLNYSFEKAGCEFDLSRINHLSNNLKKTHFQIYLKTDKIKQSYLREKDNSVVSEVSVCFSIRWDFINKPPPQKVT